MGARLHVFLNAAEDRTLFELRTATFQGTADGLVQQLSVRHLPDRPVPIADNRLPC